MLRNAANPEYADQKNGRRTGSTHRSKHPVEPTEIGKQVLNYAREILTGPKKITELIEETKSNIVGTVRLGVIPTVAPYLLPMFLARFIRHHPHLSVEIDELLTNQIVDRIHAGTIDIGIIATPIKEENLVEHPLYYEPFVAYISRSSKLDAHDRLDPSRLTPDQLWLLNDGHCFRNQTLNLCGVESNVKRRFPLEYKTGSLESIITIVDQNYGYTLLPQLATVNMNDERKRRVRQLVEPIPTREISIVTHKGYLKLKLIEALKQEILENIPLELKNNKGMVVEWK
jgi:LysR family hydrogen peroxide-inducible transcriptional activator